jgi:hypothetical protein
MPVDTVRAAVRSVTASQALPGILPHHRDVNGRHSGAVGPVDDDHQERMKWRSSPTGFQLGWPPALTRGIVRERRAS